MGTLLVANNNAACSSLLRHPCPHRGLRPRSGQAQARHHLRDPRHCPDQAQPLLVFGEGRWVFDLEAGKSLDWAHFGGFEHLGVYDLARFDLKKNYFISSADARKCEEKDLT